MLSGPFGQLTFRLRSGDNSEETTEDETVVEQIATPVQPSILHLPRERVQSDTVSISGSVPETDIDQLLCTSPAKITLSPARSETDSVNLALGDKFNQVGPHSPTISDIATVSTSLSSQSFVE